jgi:hypothetical protein
MTNLEKSFIAMQAAQFCKAWGMWAAVRFTMKRTGWNYATALRCVTVARICEIDVKLNGNFA